MTIREFTKKALKSNPVGRALYEPAHTLWRMYSEPKRRRALQKHGDETIRILHDFFKKNNIEYYLDFGTLLGIIRENGFIKHDDDIDLTIRRSGIKPKEMLKKLSDMGFAFIHGFHAVGKTLEATIARNGLTVDIFFGTDNYGNSDNFVLFDCVYDTATEYPSTDANSWRAWFFPKSTCAEDFSFHGYTVCLPKDFEQMLKLEYGQTWRTPIKNFEYKQEELHYEYQDGYAYRVLSIDKLPE